MKGAIYHGIENVSVEEIEMPECGDYDVILKNVKGSICGTDVGAYYHGGDDAGIYPENQFGHEMSSIVYQVGSKVDPHIKKGMRVFPNPCLSKRPDCGLSSLSICDECGAFSQYVQIQDAKLDYNIFELPENVSFDEAAIIEPFSVGMHGVNVGRAKAGEKVVIFGAGMIGLCALSACISKGIKDIVVVDINEWRLSKAKEMGAAPYNANEGNLLGFLQGLYGDDLINFGGNKVANIDLYIDTSGANTIIPEVTKIAKMNSRLVIIALYHHESTFNPLDLVYSEMEIMGSIAYNDVDIKQCIQALHEKSTPVEKIITHHYPLKDIDQAFKQAAKSNETLKILIDHEK